MSQVKKILVQTIHCSAVLFTDSKEIAGTNVEKGSVFGKRISLIILIYYYIE